MAQEYSTLGRLHKKGNTTELIRATEGDSINYLLENHEINIHSGEEAIFRGYVKQEIIHQDGKTEFRPVLVIQSITPISLKLIGQAATGQEEISIAIKESKPEAFAYNPFPVTTEIASAITLTSTVLLMQSLTVNPAEPQMKQQLNSGLVVFAGTLATLMFIFDQLQDNKK